MKSRNIIIIIVALLIIVAGISFYLFRSNPYTEYSRAFSNTTKTGSFEYNTTINILIDGEETSANGNLKIKNMDTNVNFINTMNINNKKITQFSDGNFIYMDDGENKTKFKLGEKPEMKDKGEFNSSNFTEEFSGLLDASKIKDLKIADLVDKNIVENIEKNGDTYELTLAPTLVEDIFKSLINSETQNSAVPEFTLKSFLYSATENSSQFIESITYSADTDVKFPKELTGKPEETKNLQIKLTLNIVNPGSPVDFTIPSTEGYAENN